MYWRDLEERIATLRSFRAKDRLSFYRITLRRRKIKVLIYINTNHLKNKIVEKLAFFMKKVLLKFYCI
jgi:hypothetical protein